LGCCRGLTHELLDQGAEWLDAVFGCAAVDAPTHHVSTAFVQSLSEKAPVALADDNPVYNDVRSKIASDELFVRSGVLGLLGSSSARAPVAGPGPAVRRRGRRLRRSAVS
jgi:hypothetical protein